MYFTTKELDALGRIRVIIQSLDPEIVSAYAVIALEEYERAGYKHGGIEEQFIGVLGELAVKEALDHYGIDYHYYERKRKYWMKEKGTPDFKILPKGPFLEICTTPPTYKFCTVKETKLEKKWDYAIAVRIETLEYECMIPYKGKRQWYRIDASMYPRMFHEIDGPSQAPKPSAEPVGSAIIHGFGTRWEIEHYENGWRYSYEDKPCRYEPCICKEIDLIVKDSPTNKLWMALKMASSGE